MEVKSSTGGACLAELRCCSRAGVPPAQVPNVLSTVAAIGLLFIIWGVLLYDPWPTLFGTMMAYLGKLWFADRMGWLLQDMQDATPEYQSWQINKKR